MNQNSEQEIFNRLNRYQECCPKDHDVQSVLLLCILEEMSSIRKFLEKITKENKD
jgi:hypothetical protein